MNNIDFWKAAGIRASRTFLQVILGVWSAGQLISEVDWKLVLASAVSASVYSMLTSILAGLPEVDYAEHIHMSKEEPEDSWIDEYEVFDYGDEIGIEEGDYDGKE